MIIKNTKCYSLKTFGRSKQTTLSVYYTYRKFNIVVCCRLYWREFRHREGKQICWHLRCWIKTGVAPVPNIAASWECGKDRRDESCSLISLFSIGRSAPIEKSPKTTIRLVARLQPLAVTEQDWALVHLLLVHLPEPLCCSCGWWWR